MCDVGLWIKEVAVDAIPRAGNSDPATALVRLSGDEANRHQHTQRFGCVTKVEPGSGTAIQLRAFAHAGEPRYRSDYAAWPAEKDSTRWEKISYVNVHDGTTHTLNPPSLGDAAGICTKRVRKQKTDRQDAQLTLRLMLEDRFPQIWVPNGRIEICGNCCGTGTGRCRRVRGS